MPINLKTAKITVKSCLFNPTNFFLFNGKADDISSAFLIKLFAFVV